jgi:hypothetical protein
VATAKEKIRICGDVCGVERESAKKGLLVVTFLNKHADLGSGI